MGTIAGQSRQKKVVFLSILEFVVAIAAAAAGYYGEKKRV